MIIKPGGILYLFDFDGTLMGQDDWSGYFKNWKYALNEGPYINPHDFDIRWSILTGRPTIDKWPLLVCCWLKGLYPEKVILSPTPFTMHKKIQVYEWKLKKLQELCDTEFAIFQKIRPVTISKVFYMDSDPGTVEYINARRKASDPYMALGVQDFAAGNFQIYM
jgi:hypothetical protein